MIKEFVERVEQGLVVYVQDCFKKADSGLLLGWV